MKHALSAFRRYLRRSSQSGQSVVLLALGFIALAGFVGITTDISLMFVRYSQLSRAVDSAAIAAANQMRQDRSNASVQLAARQFIEFYGLSPESVIVDTCITTNYTDAELCTDDQAKLVRVRAYFRQPTVFLRLLGVQSFDMWVAATSQTAALDVVIVMDVSESMAKDTTLGDWARTEKLSPLPDGTPPTVKNYGVVFLPPTINEIYPRFGVPVSQFNDFWLTWKKGPNPAWGLLNNTQAVVNSQLMYYPRGSTIGTDDGGRVAGDTGFTGNPAFKVLYANDVFTDAKMGTTGYYGTGSEFSPRRDCRVRFYPAAMNVGAGRFKGYKNSVITGGGGTPETYTTWTQLMAKAGIPGDIVIPASGNGVDGKPAYKLKDGFGGFLPVYNYYGCCNDPDGDSGFDDLVCQPFKQVREATFGFLDRIDFLRGDRAAFVTYDRTAFLVNPHYYVPGTSFDEDARLGAMLDDKEDAYKTLKNLIGVRSEPYFYVMKPKEDPSWKTEIVPRWESQAMGLTSDGTGSSKPMDLTKVDYKVDDPSVPEAVNYPVFDNCEMQNAMQVAPQTLFSNPNGLPSLAAASIPSEKSPPVIPPVPPATAPKVYFNMGYDAGWKNYYNGGETIIQHNAATPSVRTGYQLDASYESWAACRNGNIGAALREANNALLNTNTSRRFGTIWIIVLMSDGGAGASDPVRRNGEPLVPGNPYAKLPCTPVGSCSPAFTYGTTGEYGAFGLCPIGSPTGNQQGELILYANDKASRDEASPPYCADESPQSRHTCDFRPLLLLPSSLAGKNYEYADANPMGDNYFKASNADPAGPGKDKSKEYVLEWNKRRDHVYDVDIEPTQTLGLLTRGGCDPLYDVEDYARDWADYIAIANLGATGSNEQVPTIFTIGFAIRFDPTLTPTLLENAALDVNHPTNADEAQQNVAALCQANVANCLGEQLLRYIADIGDNNRIDNDYYQDLMYEWYKFEYNPGDKLMVDGYVGDGKTPFGNRDACQYSDTKVNPYLNPINNNYDNGGGVVSEAGTGLYKPLSAAEEANELGQLRANVSCGNYYYSPNTQQLQFVFDDIASRMFTRLSR